MLANPVCKTATFPPKLFLMAHLWIPFICTFPRGVIHHLICHIWFYLVVCRERERERERERGHCLLFLKEGESSEEEGLWIKLTGSDSVEKCLSGVVSYEFINGLTINWSTAYCSFLFIFRKLNLKLRLRVSLSSFDTKINRRGGKKLFKSCCVWIRELHYFDHFRVHHYRI